MNLEGLVKHTENTSEIEIQAEPARQRTKSNQETTDFGNQANLMHLSDYYTDKGQGFSEISVRISLRNQYFTECKVR